MFFWTQFAQKRSLWATPKMEKLFFAEITKADHQLSESFYFIKIYVLTEFWIVQSWVMFTSTKCHFQRKQLRLGFANFQIVARLLGYPFLGKYMIFHFGQFSMHQRLFQVILEWLHLLFLDTSLAILLEYCQFFMVTSSF